MVAGLGFALPDYDHPPSCRLQSGAVLRIAPDIALELG